MKMIFKHMKKSKGLKNIDFTHYVLSPKQFPKALHVCHFFKASTGYTFNLPAKIHSENPQSTGGHLKHRDKIPSSSSGTTQRGTP